MSFIRHVGKHGDRKVAVVFREVPGEPHMCLVVYTELLGIQVHDPLIKCIESDIGQQSESLADALSRTYTLNGAPILGTLHAEGKLKKVNTDLIVMTPAPNTKIKLSELNKILDEMKLGEDAVKRLADIDKSRGMQDPIAVVANKMRGNKKAPAPIIAEAGEGALGNAQLAKQTLDQSVKMEAEGQGLIAEAKRLRAEAMRLHPTVAKAPRVEAKKVSVVEASAARVRKIRSKVAA